MTELFNQFPGLVVSVCVVNDILPKRIVIRWTVCVSYRNVLVLQKQSEGKEFLPRESQKVTKRLEKKKKAKLAKTYLKFLSVNQRCYLTQFPCGDFYHFNDTKDYQRCFFSLHGLHDEWCGGTGGVTPPLPIQAPPSSHAMPCHAPPSQSPTPSALCDISPLINMRKQIKATGRHVAKLY